MFLGGEPGAQRLCLHRCSQTHSLVSEVAFRGCSVFAEVLAKKLALDMDFRKH